MSLSTDWAQSRRSRLLGRGVSADRDRVGADRITMREVPSGATVLLLNHVCQPAQTPYRATHAIFVQEGARETYDRVNEVPEVMRRRLLSLRAFDAEGMMRGADIVDGAAVEPLIARFLADPAIAYIHAHYARRGCYAGRIGRAL